MTDAKKKKDDTAERVAQLERELAEVKAAVPKPQKSFAEMEREAREYASQMHELREGRMSLAMPPSAVRYFADGVSAADCADLRRASHRPTGPSPMAPSSPPVTSGGRPANVPGGGTGWAHSAPLGPPPGVAQADRLMDAQDAKDRAELIRQEAKLKAMQKLADQTEALAKLAEKK
jgi:hypothetical protein